MINDVEVFRSTPRASAACYLGMEAYVGSGNTECFAPSHSRLQRLEQALSQEATLRHLQSNKRGRQTIVFCFLLKSVEILCLIHTPIRIFLIAPW